jgi:hypothetical protein
VLILGLLGTGGYFAYDAISKEDIFKKEKKPWDPNKKGISLDRNSKDTDKKDEN